jgi:NhaP-type Na+/H+ or K+/H+ antiporter
MPLKGSARRQSIFPGSLDSQASSYSLQGEPKGAMVLDTHIVLLTVFGAITLITAWIPILLKDLPLSLPIVCIAIGILLGWSPLVQALPENPLESLGLTERLTEFVVIVALMGAGLKLDRRLGWRRWMVVWRLLGVAMPLTIAGVAILGWTVLGLSLASALLLGAALAPTDPVLASDVQVGPPREGTEDEVRFALTAEAGLNDGLSFPFVYLAVAVALAEGQVGTAWLLDWALVDVLWRLAAGIGVGLIAGLALGYLIFRLPDHARISRSGDGFVALGVTCLTYGIAELVHGYGFLAVFVAALTVRASEREHEYHAELHSFVEQVERLLMMVLLVCFGLAVAEGSIFASLDLRVAAVAVAILLVIRPVCAGISLRGAPITLSEATVIAFFGIRGLGSFYYLAFALSMADFDEPRVLWVTVCLVVLLSIVMHGVTVTPIMRRLDKRRK